MINLKKPVRFWILGALTALVPIILGLCISLISNSYRLFFYFIFISPLMPLSLLISAWYGTRPLVKSKFRYHRFRLIEFRATESTSKILQFFKDKGFEQCECDELNEYCLVKRFSEKRNDLIRDVSEGHFIMVNISKENCGKQFIFTVQSAKFPDQINLKLHPILSYANFDWSATSGELLKDLVVYLRIDESSIIQN